MTSQRAILAVGALVVASVISPGKPRRPGMASADLIDAAGRVIGHAQLVTASTGSVRIHVELRSAHPGRHGIHFHSVGSCIVTGFSTAGSHFDPWGRRHGLHSPAGPHAGDLPELEVDKTGHGLLDVTTNRVTLVPGVTSLLDADGSALVVHANPDDQVTDPGGKSGDRIACGVLTA